MERTDGNSGQLETGAARHAAFAAIVALFAVLRWCSAAITDDAYITFAYARNLAEGHGLVFFPGEHVMGTTTPLFAVFAAVGIAAGIAPWNWVLAWDVVWLGGALWRMRRVFERGGAGSLFPHAGLALAGASIFTLPVGGMETGPYLFLIASAVDRLSALGVDPASDRAATVAMAWATGAAMLRPDGMVLLAVASWLALAGPIRTNDAGALVRRAWPLVALPLYAGWLFATFGDVVPHSLRAKSETSAALAFHEMFAGELWRFLAACPAWPNALAIAGVAAAWRVRSEPCWRPAVLFAAAYAAFFVVGRAPDFAWYRTPIAWFLLASGAAGVAAAMARVSAGFGQPRWAGALGLAGVALLGFPIFSASVKDALREAHARIDAGAPAGFRAAAEFIRENSEEGDVIAAHEVGELGYFSGRPIYDLEGLVTAPALEALRRGVPKWELLKTSGARWYAGRVWSGDAAGRRRAERQLAADGFSPAAEFTDRFGFRFLVFRRNAA